MSAATAVALLAPPLRSASIALLTSATSPSVARPAASRLTPASAATSADRYRRVKLVVPRAPVRAPPAPHGHAYREGFDITQDLGGKRIPGAALEGLSAGGPGRWGRRLC